MKYVISRSKYPNDVNRWFMSDVVPRIGKSFEHDGRIYRVLDIECIVQDDDHCSAVRSKVARLV